MLPIIGLFPDDEKFSFIICDRIIHELKVYDPSVIFDQTLCFKALEIITGKVLKIFAGFMLMSFYGNIGKIISGFVIEKVCQCIYGHNAVKLLTVMQFQVQI